MFFVRIPIQLMFVCRFQIFRVEQYFGSSLDTFLEHNGAKTPEEDGTWVRLAETEEFMSEMHVL